MNVSSWLAANEQQLRAADIATARLDALVLLEDALHTNRTHLLAHLDAVIPNDTFQALHEHIERRCNHEPLAYIRGHTEFYGHDFVVSPAVLEPRPESEAMIELLSRILKNYPDSRPIRVADVGTGSGALGISAALLFPGILVDLLEIDKSALTVAEQNVKKHGLNLPIIASDLLQHSPNNYDILLCNLPYVPDTYSINEAASHEPRIAIFGGADGLDLYRKLFEQLETTLNKASIILAESLPEQHDALRALAEGYGYLLSETDDFIQSFTYQ